MLAKIGGIGTNRTEEIMEMTNSTTTGFTGPVADGDLNYTQTQKRMTQCIQHANTYTYVNMDMKSFSISIK